MSFLYDEKILNEFNKILKTAQQTSLNEVAKKLVNNLDSQLNPTNPSVDDSITGHEHGFEVNYNDLSSLDTFLKHCYENQVQFNKKYLVNSDKNDNERAEVLVKNTPVYVHKQAFSDYLTFLGNKAKETKDKLLASLVNNLITQSKDITNSVNKVNVKYDDELHEGSKLLDANISFLDPALKEMKSLEIGDLKDKLKFNEWIKKATKNLDTAYSNLSKFFYYLKSVFENNINRADTKYIEDLFTQGLIRLNNLAKSFNVSFTNSDSGTTQETNQSPEDQNLIISNIINALPLTRENISIPAINAFYKELTKLQGFNSFQTATTNYLNQAKSLTNLEVFPITSSYAQVFNSLATPDPNNFHLYIQNLQAALDTIYNAINTFRAKIGNKHPEGNDELDMQIGQTESDFSMYRANTNSIKNLENKFKANFRKV